MNKELFASSIGALKEQWDHDVKCSDAAMVIWPDSFGGMYSNEKLFDTIITMLASDMDDKHDWIGYFVWELHFGRDWEPGSVTDGDYFIDLSTAEKLYDFLKGEKDAKDDV